jgi:phage gp16-like protein
VEKSTTVHEEQRQPMAQMQRRGPHVASIARQVASAERLTTKLKALVNLADCRWLWRKCTNLICLFIEFGGKAP